MRQVQYLTQVLQQIIFKKNKNHQQEAIEEIQDAFKCLTKDQTKQFNELNLEETLDLFIRNNKFESELAISVADLLVEKGEMLEEQAFSQSQKSYSQALLLYKKSLRDDTAAVPLDIRKKINHLEEHLQYSDRIDEINSIITSQ